jgi:hypothetical protein
LTAARLVLIAAILVSWLRTGMLVVIDAATIRSEAGGTKDSYGPDCCWWERERRWLRAIVTAIVAAIVALTGWCAR